MSDAPRTIGRCELFGKIARGGMATVHLARLKGAGQFSKTVAIKLMDDRLAQDQDFVRMFLEEASLVARLRHPNIVSTLDLIQEGDELLIVMEYVEGVTLKYLVHLAREAGEPIPVDIAITVIAGALRGLHAAHEAVGDDGEPLGVVHRDVSPDNIIVGCDGFPRLIDFGVAKALDRVSTTSEGELKGKVAYMAPEQAGGYQVTRQADVFMASIVLWELLAGRRLFGGKPVAEILFSLMSDEIPPVSALVSGLPPGLDEVVARALARNPEDRWATALAMADTLEAICPPVSPTAVGAWVCRLAADRLRELRSLVREVEQAPRTTETKETTQVALTSAPRPRGPSRNVMIGAGAVAFLVIGGAAAIGGSALLAGGTQPPAASTTPSSTTSATASPTPTPSATPDPPSPEPSVSAQQLDPPATASTAIPAPPPPRLPPGHMPKPPSPKPLYGID